MDYSWVSDLAAGISWSEISVGGVYFPPLLFAALGGALLAGAILQVLGRRDLVRYIWHPPLFFVSLVVICTCALSIALLSV